MTAHSLSHLLVQPPLWLALLAAIALAGLAWSLSWLSVTGAAATAVVGFVVFGLGGGIFVVPLLVFFITSSALSKLGGSSAQTNREPGAPHRTAAQVAANGAVAVCLVLAFAYLSHRWPWYKTRYLLMLYLSAIASVNGDTWATEIGTRLGRRPRLLTSWAVAAPGASGAISGAGLVAALAGSFIIPLSVVTLWRVDAAEMLAVGWAGFLATLLDSILGAGLQAQYLSRTGGELADRALAAGDSPVRGFAWITNDVVNLLASLGGVICAWLLLRYGAYGG